MIPVTKSFLPPIEEYITQIKRAFNNEWLTNRGELLQELESKVMDYLNVSDVIIMNNGTIPLQIALKILGNNGEIITTPFSYIATSAAIVWENCIPVFVDIDEEYLTIDERKIEAAITSKTTCVLATHVFGNPCNIDFLDKIANKYNLKIIYDAAHCFGVKYKGKSIFEYGDISTCSFHATKLFHTGEGGAVFCKDQVLKHKMFYSHNFGHNGPLEYYGLGINGKISELQAAMGLSVLPYVDEIIENRREVVDFYNKNLIFNKIKTMRMREDTQWNNSYYPIIFDSSENLLKVQKALNEEQIFPRRYFYPSLNTIEYLKGKKMPVSESIASRILCLPLGFKIQESDLHKICSIININ